MAGDCREQARPSRAQSAPLRHGCCYLLLCGSCFETLLAKCDLISPLGSKARPFGHGRAPDAVSNVAPDSALEVPWPDSGCCFRNVVLCLSQVQGTSCKKLSVNLMKMFISEPNVRHPTGWQQAGLPRLLCTLVLSMYGLRSACSICYCNHWLIFLGARW